MAVQPAHGPEHDLGRQMAHTQLVMVAQPLGQPRRVCRSLQNPLGRIVEIGEVVLARCEKAPDFGDGIVDIEAAPARARRRALSPGTLAIRQRKLLLAIGGVEPQKLLPPAPDSRSRCR